jgi:hypothetical protein
VKEKTEKTSKGNVNKIDYYEVNEYDLPKYNVKSGANEYYKNLQK